MRRVLIPLVLSLIATPALASDGVLEINQTCAVETGCFPGDTAGFPVSITEPGTSYVLTSRLIVPNENTDGIVISTSDVGIDLNNFAIIRSGCESASNCSPASGIGSGVKRTSTVNRGLSVRNGSITGMGSYGVFLGPQAEVTNLRVRWNRLSGIATSNGSTVSGNTAYQNGGDGINAGNGSTISGNTTFLNGGNGISGNSGSVISGNASYENMLDGIAATNGCTIRGNSVRANDEWGLDIGSTTSAYRENTISTLGTPLGTVDGGTNAGGNVCNGSLSCP